jgi:hypothetical protein
LEQSLTDDKGGRSLSDRLDQIEKGLDFFAGFMKAQQKVARETLDTLKKLEKDKSK